MWVEINNRHIFKNLEQSNIDVKVRALSSEYLISKSSLSLYVIIKIYLTEMIEELYLTVKTSS